MFILKNSYPKGLVMISKHMIDKNIFLKSFVAKKKKLADHLPQFLHRNKQKKLSLTKERI